VFPTEIAALLDKPPVAPIFSDAHFFQQAVRRGCRMNWALRPHDTDMIVRPIIAGGCRVVYDTGDCDSSSPE
jgi:hypothetical protein